MDYVIVHNHFQDGVASSWENPKLEPDVTAFREAFSPVEIRMDARRPDLQRMMRTMNVTLGDVGERKTNVPELRAPDMTLRARTYRFRSLQPVHQRGKVLLPMSPATLAANDKSAWIRDLRLSPSRRREKARRTGSLRPSQAVLEDGPGRS